jgi:hypothetical protein
MLIFQLLVPPNFPLSNQTEQLHIKVLLLETNVYVTLRTINLFDIKPEMIFFSLLSFPLTHRRPRFQLKFILSFQKTGIEESDVLQSYKRKRTKSKWLKC